MRLNQIIAVLIGFLVISSSNASGAKKTFIILSGGPGLYNPADKDHDTVWDNYIRPLLIQTKENQLTLEPDEEVDWLVYSPAYKRRWDDDRKRYLATKVKNGYSETTSKTNCLCEKKECPCVDYMHVILSRAVQHNWNLIQISDAEAFWEHIKKLRSQSITRVWYIGHAKPDGLMLSNPVNIATELISIYSIDSKIAGKFLPFKSRRYILEEQYEQWSRGVKIDQHNNYEHNFYGCNTEAFALKWAESFNVIAAGAKNKIKFNDIMKNHGRVSLTVQAQWTVHVPELGPDLARRQQVPGPIP